MAVSQTTTRAGYPPPVAASPSAQEAITNARVAGISLLVALASIMVFQIGGSVVGGGTRPEDADTLAPVAAYFGHAVLADIFIVGLVTVLALLSFALSVRRYLHAFRPTPAVFHVIDLGAVAFVVLVAIYAVVIGLGLAVIRLAGHGDPAALGVFAAFTWIYDGTLNWIEGAAIGLVSLGALLTGGWPRWLAGFGLLVAILLLVLAAPGLLIGYPDSIAFGAYIPETLWMMLAGIYLVRGGKRSVLET